MVQGASGRVVIEIEPHLKRQLYSTLAAQGMTLKEWFIRCSEHEIERHPFFETFCRASDKGATPDERTKATLTMTNCAWSSERTSHTSSRWFPSVRP